MKRLTLALLSAGLIVSSPFALAGPHGGDFGDYAKVTRVEPLVEVVRVPTERQECWQEEVVHRQGGRPDSFTGTILGGIIGGAVGNQFGAGSGRDAATVAGVALGASVGHDMSRRTPARTYSTLEDRCEMVPDYRTEERIEGYRVYYRYQGHDYVTRMPYDPGKRLRVQVSVAPAE